ncbi:pyruvate, water dikinase [bacterium]|nr:pyruvate, water dikinase [bacterium]
MNRVIQFFKNRFSAGDDGADAQKLAELRLDFKSRFHSFKLLLQANNSALEKMAAMEKTLTDRRPFGMPFVKATATAATVDVFRMIRNLDEISSGKYGVLNDRFNEIQNSIVRILSTEKPAPQARLTIPFSKIFKEDAPRVGSKMAKLCEARNRLGLAVPDGFVVTAAAYQRFIDHNDLQVEINRRFQTADFERIDLLQQVSRGIEKLILEAVLPDDVTTAIQEAYADLEQKMGRPFGAALRSSALGEDLARTSFAGQYLSKLNVGRDDIIASYKAVVASKYSLQAVVYRFNCGFRDEDNAMCVGCMAMVPARAGGVVYSRDPVNSDTDTLIINSAWGLPKLVVDGSSSSDQLSVSRQFPHAIIDHRTEIKETQIVCASRDGTQSEEIDPARRAELSIDAETATRLAHWSLQLERHFQAPQDIEWALSYDGKLFILQCRPLLQMVREQLIQQDDGPSDPAEQPIVQGGITVSSGSGWGPVVVVETISDMGTFPPGSVLVTRQALPRWAPLLDRAAAVVTERGSFAGHLGNVAREFGVPAIFDLPGAREILRHAGPVTVDATRTRIYQGKLASLLTRSEAKKNLIEGSPVFETLKAVSRQIVPLNLIDPDSTDFRAERCQTLHDITRFIHETAVQEIFNFGREFRFSEKTSKQLMFKVPMQWWVLNLDDGFKKEISGRYVRLEEICSIPMLALWDGIVAVPWAGPPRIDGRGLMSVMFQATTNRALNGGDASRLAEKNYFMISRHFCSLASRLGFHFSTVESIISEKEDENYICFQYRGGAADFNRRLRRVRFLGDILEENGFIITVREDTLVARLEKREAAIMVNKLKIIGYLTIHSRQLDMIMTNNAAINYYREKIRRDITGLISSDNDRGRQMEPQGD